MKTALKIILLTGVIGYLVFTVATLSKKNEDYVCCGVDVVISNMSEKALFNKEFVSDILANKKISPQGQTISKININRIEQIIGENAYIDSVQCYFTPKHNLCIRVISRKPVMHVITDDTEYYMDANGNVMPPGNFNLDLCLMTGNISEKLAKDKLLPLASFLDSNEPWKNEIQQVNVIDEQHIELIPMTGDHRIRIGNSDNIKEKMDKLLLFREEGLDKVGWNKYAYIDLSYNGQVVCTKKN
jgi:cell division protein FtsQ